MPFLSLFQGIILPASQRKVAAIDFETANNERSSVCSVGIVIVRDGEIVDSFKK